MVDETDTRTEPMIAVAGTEDGKYVGVMHLRDKVRTVFGDDLPRIAHQMRSMASAEFGMVHGEGVDLVDQAMSRYAPVRKAAPAPAKADTKEDAKADTRAALVEKAVAPAAAPAKSGAKSGKEA